MLAMPGMARTRTLLGFLVAAVVLIATGFGVVPAQAHSGHGAAIAPHSGPTCAHHATVSTPNRVDSPCHDACCAKGAACCVPAILPGLALVSPARRTSRALRPGETPPGPDVTHEAWPRPPRPAA